MSKKHEIAKKMHGGQHAHMSAHVGHKHGRAYSMGEHVGTKHPQAKGIRKGRR
jgi:hypothetical protein